RDVAGDRKGQPSLGLRQPSPLHVGLVLSEKAGPEMENAQRPALRHHGYTQVAGARGSRNVFTERRIAVPVYPVYFPGPQGPAIVTHEAFLLSRGRRPESNLFEAVVRRLGAAKVECAGIGGEQGVNQFGDFGVAFLGRDGRLEEVALLKERVEFTGTGIQFVQRIGALFRDLFEFVAGHVSDSEPSRDGKSDVRSWFAVLRNKELKQAFPGRRRR